MEIERVENPPLKTDKKICIEIANKNTNKCEIINCNVKRNNKSNCNKIKNKNMLTVLLTLLAIISPIKGQYTISRFRNEKNIFFIISLFFVF